MSRQRGESYKTWQWSDGSINWASVGGLVVILVAIACGVWQGLTY